MEERFSLDEYKNKFIRYAIDKDYSPREMKVIKYILKNMFFDERRHIAIFICKQEEIYRDTAVSRVTISKTIQMLVESKIISRDTYLVIKFNLKFFESLPEESCNDVCN